MKESFVGVNVSFDRFKSFANCRCNKIKCQQIIANNQEYRRYKLKKKIFKLKN